jgi:hypothetical protein
MNVPMIKLAACVAWAGAAVSSASPANAYAVTSQVGDYASCSASYTTISKNWCYDGESRTWAFATYYAQNIKFVSTPCSSGGCSDTGNVYTEFLYGPGRKIVTPATPCDASNIYGLDTCGC